MKPSEDPSSTLEAVLDELTELDSPEERQAWLEGHRDTVTPAFVLDLCTEVLHVLRVDLQRAERLARCARHLADNLGDDFVTARSHRIYANVLHRTADYQLAMREYERARDLFTALGDRHELAVTSSTAIHNLIYIGDYDRAYAWSKEARGIFEESGDLLRLARLRLHHANIFYRQDRWEEAIREYHLALAELREHGEPADEAICLRTMAVCQISLNRFDEAMASYKRASELCEALGMPLVVLTNTYNIAYLYYQKGEYTRALQLYKAVRAQCERIKDNEHLALCDLDQSEIFLELNLVEEAAQLGQSAFDRFEKMGMSYEAAKSLTIMAIANSRQGKEFLALELLLQARAIFEKEGNQVWPAQIDLYRALVYYSEGRLIEAQRLTEKALDTFTALAIRGKAALCRSLLARVALEAQRPEAARRHCQEALELAAGLRVPTLAYQAHFVLGQIEEAAGNLIAARSAYRESQEQLERLRSHLQTDELKITFLADKLIVYESLVALLLEGRPNDEEKAEAFSFIEKSKSRSLADLMAFRAQALPPKSSTRSNLVEQIRNLREELNWYYRRIDLQQMQIDERSRSRLESLRRESDEREEHLVRTLRELQTTDEEFSSLQAATTVDLEDIRSVLPEGHLLLEFYTARDIVYGALIGRDVMEIQPLTVTSRVQELYRLLQFQLSKFLLGNDYVVKFRDLVTAATEKHLRSLYDELIAPFAERLECEHLTIVPHDFLHHVPFQALSDGNEQLIDRFSISYAPSASVYYLCQKKERATGSGALVLGVGDQRAPQIEREAIAVAETLCDATLLLDDDASDEALRSHGETSRIIHIATHGVFRRDNPMFSAIQLGRSRLSLFDLYNLNLTAELVVLSGCGTGLNVVMGADELVGLARGILYAGAQSVLVTLWDVHDESAADTMCSFYRHYASGASAAAALRAAMRETREKSPHPYYWAPFVLIGRSDRRSPEERS